MPRHQVSFDNLARLLDRQVSENLPQMRAQPRIECLAAAIRNEDYVIFVVPNTVA